MAEAAADWAQAVSRAGGIAGERVAIIRLDDQCNPEVSRTLAEQLISKERVIAVVGHCGGAAAAVRDVYENAKVPVFIPGGIRELGGRPSRYVFHLGMREDRLAEAVVREMRARKIGSRIGVLSDSSAYSQTITAELKKRGLAVMFELDLRNARLPMALDDAQRRSRADALFLAALDPRTAIAQLRGDHSSVPVFAGGFPEAPAEVWDQFWREAGPDAHRMLVIAPAEPKPLTPIGRDAVLEWKRSALAERSSRDLPPALYGSTLAAFEILGGVLSDMAKLHRSRDVGATREFIASRMRESPQPTFYGELRSGETGEVQTPLAVFPPKFSWSPAGIKFERADRYGLYGGSPLPLGPAPAPPPPPPPRPAPAPAPKPRPAPPPPPPPVAISQLPEPGVFWNSWVEDGGVPTKRLDLGVAYDLVVDLSRYRYVLAQSASASVALGGEVRRAIEAGRKDIELVIRPVIVGSALVRPVGAPADYRIKVELAKLAHPDDATLASDLKIWAEFTAGRMALPQVSRAFRAAVVTVPFKAAENGCAQVALSIWDRSGLRPLDHVVHSISVGADDACGLKGRGAVQAGETTLLEGLPQEGAALADAALHVFDLPEAESTLHKAIALFVDGTPLVRGEAPVLHSWRLQSRIDRYLSDQLLALLVEARKTGSYAAPATELAKKLFSEDAGRPGEAEAALAALKRIAKGASGQAVLLTRVAADNHKLVYLPLALLAAASPAPVLERSITVVHPSPEPSGKAPGCIAPWTFAIPAVLDGLGEIKVDPEDAAFVSGHRRDSIASLRNYIDETAAAGAPPRPAEGLVLLAHHEKGIFWFEQRTDRIVIEDLKRSFAPGSVALLSACSTASPDNDNDQWVKRISAQGIDAVAASPFPVPTRFGVELARGLVGAVHAASTAHETPTFAQLFARATDRAARALENAGVKAAEVRLEFVLIGDHGIRMCKGTP